jgi:type II secretory pathway pseudopilin PulG
LIIVVVILGILVAIAIPIFLNIQQQARDNSAKAVAATGATQAASQIAQNQPVDLSNLVTGDATAVSETGTTIDTICVSVTFTGATDQPTKAGPGC